MAIVCLRRYGYRIAQMRLNNMAIALPKCNLTKTTK